MAAKPKNTANEYYKLAIRQYGEAKYDEAISSFDKAMSLGDRSLPVQDGKAAAMNKLGGTWRDSAYELAEKVCISFERDKYVYKAWYRKADILRGMHLFAQAVRTLDHADMVLRASSLPTAEMDKAERLLKTLRDRIIAENRAAGKRRTKDEKDDEQRSRAAEEAGRVLAIKSKTNYIHLLPPDVLVMICQSGQQTQKNYAVRMATVCRGWRQIITEQRRLWGTLVLRSRKPVAKARMWGERGGDQVHTLVFEENFDTTKLPEVLEVLECTGVTASVRNLTIQTQQPSYFGGEARHLFRSLRSLRLIDKRKKTCNDLDEDLLMLWGVSAPTTQLQHLRLGNCDFGQHIYGPARLTITSWASGLEQQFRGLRSLELEACFFSTDQADYRELLRFTPEIQDFSLRDLVLNPRLSAAELGLRDDQLIDEPPAFDDSVITLSDCHTWREVRISRGRRFDRIRLPALRTLDMWSCGPLDTGLGVLDKIYSPGLDVSRSQLTFLDIGKTAVDLQELVGVLRRLPSLKYLGVAYCGIDSAFMQNLVRDPAKPTEDQVLPQLTAMSLAGNDTLSAGAVRDLIWSRLPGRKLIITPGPSQQPKKRSAFAPSRASPQPASKTPASPPPSTPFSRPNPPPSPPLLLLPSLNWLCLDGCEAIDPSTADLFRKKVHCVLHRFGAADETRVRGQGRWSWDAEWRDSCMTGEERMCELRRVPGSKTNEDKWYVHHRCDEEVEEGAGWSQVTQSSGSLGLGGRSMELEMC